MHATPLINMAMPRLHLGSKVYVVGMVSFKVHYCCEGYSISLPPTSTVLPALRANSCIAIDRLMIELLDFHIPFLSFTNAGFKGYSKNLLNRRLRITQLP